MARSTSAIIGALAACVFLSNLAGASVVDLEENCAEAEDDSTCLLQKQPAQVIVHVGTSQTAGSAGDAGGIYDPRVFNPYFYCGLYPDLLAAGITSISKCRTHWKNHGIKEGRWGSGSFHTASYVQRYADLNKFGTNYTRALTHYLNQGIKEGRLGYKEGGFQGVYTASQGKQKGIFLSTVHFMAGAVHSLVWNDVEFVHNWGHDRQFQMMVSVGRDGFQNRGECYRPTEAGSHSDTLKYSTASKLETVEAASKTLHTATYPAFWLAPGTKPSHPTTSCPKALNTEKRSQYIMTKDVNLGEADDAHGIEWSGSIEIPEDVDHLQVEAPAGHMPEVFSKHYSFNADTGTLTALSSSSTAVEIEDPLIFSNAGGTAAIGVMILDFPEACTVTYAHSSHLSFPQQMKRYNKWSILLRSGSQSAGSVVEFSSRFCVGTLQQVQGCMKH